jgi:uncharacterized phage protein (TIGR01671 family)
MYIKSISEMVGNDEIKGACGGLIKAAFIATGIMGKGGLYLPIDDEDIVFMQYTGLKDKNGAEIYEGDIVEQEFMGPCPLDVGSFIGIVNFYEDGYGIENEDGTNGIMLFSEININEVLGNIYENPELLKSN